jgi:DNA-binding transcriptional MerR regulator
MTLMQTVAVVERSYPQKMFYRINEVSRITGIKSYVLRYWETEFPQLRPAKDSSDQRRYKSGDIDLIGEIKRLLYEEKFTIAGARKCLQTRNSKPAVAPEEQPVAAAVPPTRQVQRVRKMIGSLRREVNNLCNFI